ncbi:MAG: flagellar hook-length control protein FliK [Phycisphaeraceae bacterium]
MQLFNLAPTNIDPTRLAGSARGRDAAKADAGFDQALEQSRQRLKRETPPVTRQASTSASSRRDSVKAVSARNEVHGGEKSAPRAGDEAIGSTVDEQIAASDESTRPEAEPSHVSEAAPEATEGVTADVEDDLARDTAEGDDALARLRTSLRQWLEQPPTNGDEMTDDASLEVAESLAGVLTQIASSDELQNLVMNAGGAGEELARMVQQLAMQGGRSSQMADPLAALMAMTPGAGKPMGQAAERFEGMDLPSMLPAGEGDPSSGKGLRFGQLFAQVMPALSSVLSGGGQSSSQGGELQALLSQLVTATSTSQGGQSTPGSELLTALMQSGPQANQSNAQAQGGALMQAAPGQSAGEGEVQATNASRLARAMQGAVNQGGGTMTLRMTPPEMGTVRIQLQVQGGTVNAALHAESEGARTLLSQQLSQLRQSLESQGLHVERLSVQSMNGNTSASGSQQGQSDATPNDGRSRDEYRGSGQPQDDQREHDDEARPSEPAAFEQVLDDVAEQ